MPSNSSVFLLQLKLSPPILDYEKENYGIWSRQFLIALSFVFIFGMLQPITFTFVEPNKF
jgi:hypothetical protein